jgi:hypothetical protein
MNSDYRVPVIQVIGFSGFLCGFCFLAPFKKEQQSSARKKEKKGISVKKFPVFKRIEGSLPSKFLIPKEFFADSRYIRSYRHDFNDFRR